MLCKTSRQLWQTKPITDKNMFYYRRKYKKLKGGILSAVYLLFSVCSKELHPRYLNSTEVAAGLYFGPRPFSTCLTDPKIMCILVFSSDLILDCRFFTVRLYVLNQVKNYHIYILKYKTLYFYTV